ncbi:MAG: hypothetical protein ABI742_02990 [Gemmatimonadota bacterium]
MRRTSILLITALRLALVPSLAAQAPAALAIGPRNLDRALGANREGPGTALASAYTLNLVSDWPQLSADGSACVNGGQETLRGAITRTTDGHYVGQLERRATILFCGVHGAAQDACALTLTSEGPVEAEGHVLPSEAAGSAPLVELQWASAEDPSDVVIEGDCAPGFNESLRRLYIGVTHTLEFPLPLAGPRTIRLEDYGWIVDVE